MNVRQKETPPNLCLLAPAAPKLRVACTAPVVHSASAARAAAAGSGAGERVDREGISKMNAPSSWLFADNSKYSTRARLIFMGLSFAIGILTFLVYLAIWYTCGGRDAGAGAGEIGRASCRERVSQLV